MSTYTYKLKGARWLRMWTAADRSSVYAAQSEAQKIADTLCDVPWTRAKSDGPAMFPLTAAKSLDGNPANRDLFDAALFCAEHSDGAHRAYANAAMYLFKLPSTSGVNLKSVTVHVESDAYNALGARIAVHLLSSAELPTDCAIVRTGAAHAEGVAARRTVERDGRNYWYSNWDDKTITGGTSESPAAIGELKQYLAVFVGMENYATSRNEWLEGASYIRNLIEIETDGQISNWTNESMHDCVEADPAVLLADGSSPTWLEPLPTVNVTATAPTLASVTEPFFTGQQPFTTARSYDVTFPLATASFEGTYTIHCVGTTVEGVSVQFREKGKSGERSVSMSSDILIGNTVHAWGCIASSPDGGTRNLYLCMYRTASIGILVQSGNSAYTIQGNFFAYDSDSSGVMRQDEAMHYVGSYQEEVTPFTTSYYYLMLQLTNGVPTAMDKSSTNTVDGLRHLPSTVSGSGSPWTIDLDGVTYGVVASGQSFTLTANDGATTLGTFDSVYSSGSNTAFDPAARARMPGDAANAKVADYGLAAALGDFSHAVATFEAGTKPSNAEVLGRLCRMSRKSAQGMMYLHPVIAALADELDALRPVPRFFRTDGTLPEQTDCQPGLSVWYHRPNTGGTVNPSSAAQALAYRNGAGASVVKVTNPVFLQFALLALRSPSAFGSKIVLKNVGGSTVPNAFKIRFVVWVSPAEEWDRSNSFAMVASMPSIYRSDGEESVSWSVDCSGTLAPFVTRAMSARRIGVSEIVDGNIAANGEVEIALTGEVKAGDVVLIAPEVLGFNAGTDDDPASAYFGRQSAPSASANNGAWARYSQDLGWFPKVTGE